MKEKGFTLIELVVVIVILGILAATALPKFIDLSSDARTAAIQGAAGGLTSASSVNYAAVAVRGTGGTGVIRVTSAAAASALVAGGGVAGWDSTKFAIATDSSCNGSTGGASVNVTLTYAGGAAGNSAVATIICTG